MNHLEEKEYNWIVDMLRINLSKQLFYIVMNEVDNDNFCFCIVATEGVFTLDDVTTLEEAKKTMVEIYSMGYSSVFIKPKKDNTQKVKELKELFKLC